MDNHSDSEDGHFHDAVEYPQPRPQTNFWKEVREYLETRDSLPSQVPPVATCPICLEAELNIKGLPPSDNNVAGTRRRLGMVTICGHMACRDCLSDWYQTCLEDQQVVPCPVCRHELQFAEVDCGHPIKAHYIHRNNPAAPSDDIAYLQSIPLTLPENGTQPERCKDCHLAWLKSRALGAVAQRMGNRLRAMREVLEARRAAENISTGVTRVLREHMNELSEATSDAMFEVGRMTSEEEGSSWRWRSSMPTDGLGFGA